MGKNAAIALVLALGMASFAGYALYDHYRMKGEGRPVEAVITYSDTWRGEDSVHLDVEYRYTVGGETYTSAKICPGIGEGCYGDPEGVDARYPEGKRVTAYVDPEDPTESYLIRSGTPYILFLMVGVGLGFGLLAARDLIDGEDAGRSRAERR